jgi:hypothetical protein
MPHTHDEYSAVDHDHDGEYSKTGHTHRADKIEGGVLYDISSVTRFSTIRANSWTLAVIECPVGSLAISGGWGFNQNEDPNAKVLRSVGGSPGRSWSFYVRNYETTDVTLQLYATCARAGGPS